MKNVFRLFLLLAALVTVLPGSAIAGPGHYASGGEGILAATLPPPGFYWRSYLAYYNANQMRDKDGGRNPGDFHLNAISFANRFIFSTDIEILGANWVPDIVVPLGYTDVKLKNVGPADFSKQNYGLGDLVLDPFTLAWHGFWYDAVAGVTFVLPTGYFDKDNPASQGKGFTTFMPTAGATIYFDKEKTWHASILARYAIHTQQWETEITPGNDFHFEYGVGKTFADIFKVGVAGYCHWQVSDDYGKGATDARKQVYALGPEFTFDVPDWKSSVTLRVLKEFDAKATTEGVLGMLVFTKAF